MSEPSKRPPGLLSAAAAALDALLTSGPSLPEGFRVQDGTLRFVLRREEVYHERPVVLEAGVVINADQLADAMANGHPDAPSALAEAAADWASDLTHDLDELDEEIRAALETAFVTAAITGDPETIPGLLQRLPAVIEYERQVTALDGFRKGLRKLLTASIGPRLRALSDAGLPPPIEAVEEKKGRWSLRLRRQVDAVLLGAPLPLCIHEIRPLSVAEQESLCWAGDLNGMRDALARMLAPEEAVLHKELHHVLRYADLLFGQDLSADRGSIARAIEQVAAQHGDFDDYKSALGGLAARLRAEKFHNDIAALEQHRSHYANVGGYYPLARSLKREITLFLGPTNSGKTYRALNALAEGESGLYLAPLRLLALEGQGELERRGKPCSYLTGEERDLRDRAAFTSSTIEMLDFRKPVDAVLIDEIQLLADPSRGWAWTAALIGAPARRVLLTGAPGCRAAVARIAELLQEPLTVVETERLAPLEIERRPATLSKIEAGTAVIAFSRRDVLDLKSTIEDATGLRCSVIYGNLSPRVRREEARRFREGEADVIVSTDAIAMGLNLPVSRVVFFTTTKYDGKHDRLLTDHEILQIGGRAGRYGKANKGSVTALTREDLAVVQQAFQRGPGPIGPPFRVMPDERHVELLGHVLGTASLERILVFFAQAITFDDEVFTTADLTDLCALAAIVDKKLPQTDALTRLTFASAPVEVDNDPMRRSWERMMEVYTLNDEKRLFDMFEVEHYRRRRMTTDPMALLEAETHLKTLTIYSWLSYRFPAIYRSIDACDHAKDILASFIEESLRGRTVRRCSSCGTMLPLGFRFGKCEGCFRGGDGEGAGRRPGPRKPLSFLPQGKPAAGKPPRRKRA
jgi:ATP-dependent RNA helicase SUPV3L1/SUV3